MERIILILWCWSKTQVSRENKKQRSMHDITKHYTEEEWEWNTCEQGWITFLVCRNTISINDILRNSSEIVQSKKCWSLECNIFWSFFNSDTSLSLLPHFNYSLLKVIFSWAPNKTLVNDIGLVQVIQMNVDLFLSQNKELIHFEYWNIGILSSIHSS